MRTPPAVWIATAIAALLSVPATYALLRGYDVVFRNEANPANIVWSPHIAMFWRLAVGIYVAGMVAPLVYMGARRDLERTTRALSMGVLLVGALVGVQGLLMP